MSATGRHPLTGLHQQIDEFGLEVVADAAKNEQERRRAQRAATAMAIDWSVSQKGFRECEDGDVVFSHPAFCMTGLPHSRPERNTDVWHRRNGDFHLVVEPGTIIQRGEVTHVGVPYGPKARLILLYIQTHAEANGTVNLGRSMSNWLRRLGLAVTGGERGTIGPVKEQISRLARARISLHWADESGTSRSIIDRTPVAGISLWANTLLLSEEYMSALSQRRVPLSEFAIARLKRSSMALDLYCWLAYRLRDLTKPTFVKWSALRAQFGANFSSANHLAEAVRKQLPEVLVVWPGLKIEPRPYGIKLYPSPSSVPPSLVGWRRK
jgi:hypothetical protein